MFRRLAAHGEAALSARSIKSHPEIVKSMFIGFDMDKVAEIKAAIKAEMDADLMGCALPATPQ